MRRRTVVTALTVALVCLVLMAGHVGCRVGRIDQPVVVRRAPLPQGCLTVLVTGSTNGNLEPCNCPGQPRGGLSRRHTLLEALRPAYGPCVTLDVGNMLPLTADPVMDRYMLSGYGRVGYDAVAVGDQELDRGPQGFVAAARPHGLPLVATNVTADGQPVGEPFVLLQRDGRSVLVLAVVGPRMMDFSPPQVRQQIELTDPADAVSRVLERFAGHRPDLVVVLANLDNAEREAVVSRLTDADVVVLGSAKDRPIQIERIGGVAAVHAPAAGRQVAALVFAPPAEGQGPRYRLVRADGHPVEQTLPRDRPLWENYQAYTYDAQQRILGLLDKRPDVPFVASAQCGRCHVVQYDAWRRHRHGGAWSTIVREQRTGDPHCMRCHTTGFGYAGGFRPDTPSRDLVNVGCQQCHPVDLAVHEKLTPPKHVPRVKADACRLCHTESNSPAFDPVVYGPKATCPKGSPVKPPAGQPGP